MNHINIFKKIGWGFYITPKAFKRYKKLGKKKFIKDETKSFKVTLESFVDSTTAHNFLEK